MGRNGAATGETCGGRARAAVGTRSRGLVLRFIITVTYGSAEPHSPPRRGGEDSPPIRWREATESGADGVVRPARPGFRRTDHPGASRHPSSARGGKFVNAIFKRNTREELDTVADIKPELQRLFDAKETRRRKLAQLPFPEKVRIILQLQRMAAPLFRARGIKVRVWDPK